MTLGALVGLREEARILRRFLPDAPIAVSNATAEGAERGVGLLLAAGATRLLSFGCAGGLSPDVGPGTVVVAGHVRAGETTFAAEPALSEAFGASRARQGDILHSDRLITTAEEKARLFAGTGCIAVDMESGAVARTGKPFAVLRVVCDDSRRDLPPVARLALEEGRVRPPALLASLLRRPGQIPSLIALGRDAADARAAMADFLRALPSLTG